MDAPRKKLKKKPIEKAESASGTQSFPLGLLAVLFFFSGASALCYEIVWSRTLGLMLGHTIHASSIVLVGFFLGMAGGYFLAAKFELQKYGELLVYGILEIFIGMWALCIPSLVEFATSNTTSSQFSRDATLGLLLILPATFCLGATLPVLANFIGRERSGGPKEISFVYAANTAGGLVGVFAASFGFIALFGVNATNAFAALVSIGCGVIAILLLGRSQLPAISVDKPEASTFNRKCAVIASASGLVTLLLQVAYTRLFALVFHNSTYTFALVVAIYLLGLAIGAIVAGVFASRRHFLFITCSLAAFLVSLSPFVFALITQLKYFRAGSNLVEHSVFASTLVAAVVLLPVIALGTLLPVAWHNAIRESKANPRQVIGNLTALNSLAAAGGACLTSFFILPVVGLQGAFLAGTLILCLLIFYEAPNKRSIAVGAICIVICVFAGRQPYSFAIPQGAELVNRWESGYGWIEILKRSYDGVQLLRQDVQYGLGADLDVDWERRQGRIPLLMHPNPREVAFLGVGTGISVSSIVGDAAIEKVDAVELIPDVLDAAEYFASSNREFYNDPRCTVHAADARHFIKNTASKYDVIVADLFTPWHSRTGYLYTVEHFQNCKDRLRQGGIYCQWLPMWQLGKRDFEVVVDSFRTVFSRCTLWWGLCENSKPLMCLLGTEAPIYISAEKFSARLKQIDDPDVDPFLLNTSRLSHLYIGGWPRRYNCLLNTDDTPIIEFSCPSSDLSNGKLIGSEVVEYFKEVLARLPQDGVIFGEDSGPIPIATRLAWQHKQLNSVVTRGKQKPLPPRFTDEGNPK